MRKSNKKKAIIILVLLILIILISGSLIISNKNHRSDEHAIFVAFLEGKLHAVNAENRECSVTDLLENAEGKYLYWEIDGDGLEELHLRSEQNYYIIKNEEGSLHVIYEGTAYEYPVDQDELRGILYFRPGGAPTHERYPFPLFDSQGQVQEPLEFEWYDANENDTMDAGDIYLLNQEEIKEKKWKEETQMYREVPVGLEKWSDVKIQ